MKLVTRQPGLAPAVSIVDGLVYVAYGIASGALLLEVFTPQGLLVKSVSLPGGFFSSFPVFSGRWLAYRRDVDYRAAALNVVDGQAFVYDGQAGGNYPVAVNDALGLVAFQVGRELGIWFGSLLDGFSRQTDQPGAPDGISRVADDLTVILRKDVRLSVAGMLNPVKAGDLIVGERPEAGMAVQLLGDPLREAFGGQDAPVPSCATDGTLYALVTGGALGVRLLLASRADLQALPPPAVIVEPVRFSLNHNVLVVVFKDPAGESGAPAEILVNGTSQVTDRPCFVAEDTLNARRGGPLLGVYSEASTNPIAALRLAESRRTRLLLCHDSSSAWTIPSGLRPFDVPAVELYRVVGESLAQARGRWIASVQSLLAQWKGDCGVVPQFYCAGGAPPNEQWPVSEILDGLRSLSAIVNLSARVKVIAPFEWSRANGITGHPELRAAFAELLKAAPIPATLTPIPSDPPPPDKKDPGKKDPPPEKKPATRFPAARVYGAST